MNIDKYNKYARWYDKERKAAAVAVYSGNESLIKEFEETLSFLKEQMNLAFNEVAA